jgi:hypothetical protein
VRKTEAVLHSAEFFFGVQLSNEKSAKALHLQSSCVLEERAASLLSKSAVVPAFMQFGLEFGEHKYFLTSQVFGNLIGFNSKSIKTLNSILKIKIKI